jgi:hypothetical protein
MIDTFASAAASSSSAPPSSNPLGLAQGNNHQVKNPEYYRALIEHVRQHAGSAALVQERIRGKKGREMLLRCEGEVVGPHIKEGSSVPTGVDARLKDGGVKAAPTSNPDSDSKVSGIVEEEIVVRDPRSEPGFRRINNLRPGRAEFAEISYEVRTGFRLNWYADSHNVRSTIRRIQWTHHLGRCY